MATLVPIGKRRPYYIIGRSKISAHEEYVRYHDEGTVVGGSLPFSFENFLTKTEATIIGRHYLDDSLDSYGRTDVGSVTGISSVSGVDIKLFPLESTTITGSSVVSAVETLVMVDTSTVIGSRLISAADIQASTFSVIFAAEAPSLRSVDSKQSVLYTVTSTAAPFAVDIQASTFTSTVTGTAAHSYTGLYNSSEATTVSGSSAASAVDNQFGNVTNVVITGTASPSAVDVLNSTFASTVIGFGFAAQEFAEATTALGQSSISAVENYNTQNNALEPMIAHAVMFAVELPFYDVATIIGRSVISDEAAYGRVDTGLATSSSQMLTSDVAVYSDVSTIASSSAADTTTEAGDFVDASTAVSSSLVIGSLDIEDYDRGIYDYSHYDGSAAPGTDVATVFSRSTVSAVEVYSTGTIDTLPGPHVSFIEIFNGGTDVRTQQIMGRTIISFQEWFNNQLVTGHSSILTSQEIYSTAASPVTTPSSFGPTISISPTSGTSGNYVVKSDGKIYDSTGTTLVSLTNKQFVADVLIASDVAGTRRTLNVSLLAGIQMTGGRLTLRELGFNDPSANFESVGSTSSIALLMQGCTGTLGHFRVVNFAHNGIQIEDSPAGLKSGSITASWSTSSPDLRLYNCTSHGAVGNDGSALIVKAGHNIVIGGFDPGTQSTPTGLSGPTTSAAIVFDGAGLLDIQDVYIDSAPDTTPSKLGSKVGTYTFWSGRMKRSGIKSAIFTNTSGSRPEKPIYFGLTTGVLPAAATLANCTNDKVLTEHLVLKNALAENLVNATARDGSTKLQLFEVTPTVYDPATPLTQWTPSDISDVWPGAFTRFIHVSAMKNTLQARPTIAAVAPGGGAVETNISIDNTWTHMGGIAADGVTEIVGRVFNVANLVNGTGSNHAKVLSAAKGGGTQLAVAANIFQAGGTAVSLNATTGKTLVVRKPDSTDPDFTGWSDASTTISAATSATPNVVTVPSQGWATNDTVAIVETNGTYTEVQVTKVDATHFSLQGTSGSGTHWVGARIVRPGDHYGIYSGYFNPSKPDEVDTGVPYRRSLSYVGIDAANKAFLGVKVIPRPSSTPGAFHNAGGNVGPGLLPDGKILRIIAGVAESEHPHGMPTNDITDIATGGLTGTNFTITRVDDFRFLINGQEGVTWNVPGSFGTFTPSTLHPYGLTGTDNTITFNSGITLDDTKNNNMGQPTNNGSINISSGSHVRFVRCTFDNVSVAANGVTAWIELVDCDHPVAPIPGKYEYDSPSRLGIPGTYDPVGQHVPSNMLGDNNVLVPAGALWNIDRLVSTNVHGDFCQGVFRVGSYYNHVHIEHGRDIAGPSAGGANGRNGIPGTAPLVAPGPHGDIQQWYDEYMPVVTASALVTSAHSVVFSRMENNYQMDSPYRPKASDGTIGATRFVTITNSGTAVFLMWPLGPKDTALSHGMKDDDTILIIGAADTTLNGKEYFVAKNDNFSLTLKGTTSGGPAPTYTVGGSCTTVHTIHIIIPGIYRSDLITSKLVDTTDITRLSPVSSEGNVTISTRVTGLARGAYPDPATASASRAVINDLIAGQITYTAIIQDCRIQTGGGNGQWLMATPLNPADINLGSPNRNAWLNFGGGSSTAIPSKTATPFYD